MSRSILTVMILAAAILPVAAQPVLEINSGNGWTSQATSQPAYEVAVRITDQPGGWVTLSIGGYRNDAQMFQQTWMRLPPLVSTNDLHPWFESQVDTLYVPEKTTELLSRLGLGMLGGAPGHSEAVRDWFVPILDGEPTRNWSSRPASWLADIGLGLGPAHSTIWDHLTFSFTTGDITDPESFSAEALLRHALILRATLEAGNPDAANGVFDTLEFTDALGDHKMMVQLQAISVVSGQSVIAGDSDVEAPSLVGFPATNPFQRAGNMIAFPVTIPAPSGGGIIQLGGSVTPGERRLFTARDLTYPTFAKFPTTSGWARVLVESAGTRENPLRKAVDVPTNVINGSIFMTTGLHPQEFIAAEITEILPTPN